MKKLFNIFKRTIQRGFIGVGLLASVVIGCTLVVEWEKYKEIFISFYKTLTYQMSISMTIIGVVTTITLAYIFVPTIVELKKLKEKNAEKKAKAEALKAENVVDFKSVAK